MINDATIEFKKVEMKNLGRYIGQWKENERHGMGRFIVSTPEVERNTIIEGLFRNNFLNGYGRIIFNDGSYY